MACMADVKEFQSAAIPHLDAVFRAALTLCRERNRAEDLVQTTYLKALERFGTFRSGSNCRAWLMRILHNSWIDQLRHEKIAGPSVPIEEQLLGGSDDTNESHRADARDILENFEDAQVIRALAELPDDQRLTLFLTDVEGLSQAEVAEIMGVAAGTVKSRTSRARAALRDRLIEHARDLGFLGRER